MPVGHGSRHLLQHPATTTHGPYTTVPGFADGLRRNHGAGEDLMSHAGLAICLRMARRLAGLH
jgi:hypothetical protein